MKDIYLNKEKFIHKVEKLNEKYWNNSHLKRWEYISIVIDELKNINPEKIIELGSYKINLTSISDNIDIKIDNIDKENITNKNYIQDATNVPYDISEKYYDVFIGLQVFEHLEGKQSDVFNEIKRISKYAILSFPYKWDCPDNATHHNITDDIINKWVNYTDPIKIINIGNRIIYIFDFEKKIKI